MRKLYALLAGLCFALSFLPAQAQNPVPDQANFSFTVDPATNNVIFTNTSVLGSLAGIRRAHWSFGDGSGQWTGPLEGTQHHYATAGTYNVCLKIFLYHNNTGDSILTSHICKTVVIESLCRANFEYRDSLASVSPLRHIVRFWAIPFHHDNKPVVQVCWNFGDGSDTCINITNSTSANILTIQHTYTQQGPFNVCVRIRYLDGCVAEKCKLVELSRPPDSCRADYERLPLTTTNHPNTVVLKALPWHNNNKKPSRICWSFGDGTDTCINYLNIHNGPYTVSHTYANPGRYEVCVKIFYFGGCEARKCKILEVGRPDSCKADFERIPITTSNNLLTTAFRALTWHNNNKKPARICWTFGDGQDTCINYPPDYNGSYTVTHQYAQPGNYEVCVRIFYYGGCEAHKCKQVIVPLRHCAVNVHEIIPSLTSLVRGFYAALTTNPPSPPVRICWNFGDGSDTCILATSSAPPEQIIRHTFPGPGVYRVCVRVVFANGCVAEDCHEVFIRSHNGICGGFMTDSMTAPRTFKFKGFAIHPPNDQVQSYRWTFGDGSSALGREVTHTYAHSGDFEVCLYIRTVLGCETRICKTLRVPGNNQPTLVLTPNPAITTLHAMFLSTHAETVTIRVVNSNGVVVRTVTRVAVVGTNNWDFDVSNLSPGIYTMVVQSPNQLASALFIKQ